MKNVELGERSSSVKGFQEKERKKESKKEWMVFLATQEIEGKRREVERGRNKRGKERFSRILTYILY